MEIPRSIAKRRLSRRTLLKAVCSGVIPLSGCLRKPDPPLRVGTSLWPGHAPFFLARKLGYLKGKPLKLVEYLSMPEILRGLQDGAVELAALTGNQFLRLSERLPGLRAVLVMDYSAGGDVLLAQRGISAADLPGKRTGVEPNSKGAYFLYRALDHLGHDPSKLQLEPLRSYHHEDHFNTRQVDALVTSEPYRTTLLAQQAELLFDSSTIKSEMPGLLVVHERELDERGGLIKELVTAWVRAHDYLLEKTSEASALLAPRYGVEAADFEKMLEVIAFPSLGENRQLLAGQRPGLATQLEEIQGHMLRHGLLKARMPATALIQGGLLA